MPILTIDSARLNGTPSAGTVRITASRSPLMDSGSNTVYSGTQTFPLDAQGKLSVSLPATDSPSIGPFTYTVEANLASGQWIYRGVKLPANVATIDITDAQSASQQTYPTRQEWDAIMAGMNTRIEGKVDGPGLTVRRDTSVGERVLLDHPGGSVMLYGDTGWRNMESLLEPGWAGTLRVRRANSTIWWAGDLTMPASGIVVTSTIPAGFRRIGNFASLLARNPSTSEIGPLTVVSSIAWGGTLTEGQSIRFEGSHATIDPWPSTLPGLPL